MGILAEYLSHAEFVRRMKTEGTFVGDLMSIDSLFALINFINESERLRRELDET